MTPPAWACPVVTSFAAATASPSSASEPAWAATLSFVTLAEKVLDPGPIAYADIDLYGDPDLEHALREEGLDPQATTYRLIEIPLSSIDMVRSTSWGRMGTAYIDALKAGQQFPPIVVFRNRQGWSLLDGVNRTHAHWVVGTPSIRAYDLLGS